MYNDLSDYTGIPVDTLKRTCPHAALALVFEWYTKKSVLDYYRDSPSYIFDLTHYQSDILGENFYHWFNAEISMLKNPKGLDLGGGIGEYTIQAMKHGAQMDYVDLMYSKTMTYAKWRFDRHCVTPNVYGEDFKLTKQYDFIVAMDVLEHLENAQNKVNELADHTKYLFANPEQVQYNDLYPCHISKFDLSLKFTKLGGYLWERK